MPNYAIKPTPERTFRTNRTMLPARLIAALELLGEIVVDGKVSEHANRAWENDPASPIPVIDAIDIVGKRRTGGCDLVIVIASPLDGGAYSQQRLLNKIRNYVGFIESEEFVDEFGKPAPDLVNLEVAIRRGSDPVIIELLKECSDWVNRAGAKLVIKEQF